MPKLRKDKQKKENQIKIYLTDSLLSMLETHCQQQQTKKSKLLRSLLITYLT